MELTQPAIFLFLPTNVGANHCFVLTDGRDEAAPRPKMRPGEIAPTLAIHPRHVDRTFVNLITGDTAYFGGIASSIRT